jgi:hypothetical protein
MWRSALRPQRCQISTCISGSAPRSSRLVLSAGPVRVSGWQPPVRFCASSAGTSARSLLRFRASNRATTKHARADPRPPASGLVWGAWLCGREDLNLHGVRPRMAAKSRRLVSVFAEAPAHESGSVLHRAEPQPPSLHSAVKEIIPSIGGLGQAGVFLGIEPITKLGFAGRARSVRSYFATLASKSVSPAHGASSTAPGALLLLARSSR